MDDPRKPDLDPKRPDPAAEPRDLSFLWPALDRIRAVEIKLVADDAAAENANVAARLKALEADVAAIREMLSQAIGPLTGGARAEPERARGAQVGAIVGAIYGERRGKPAGSASEIEVAPDDSATAHQCDAFHRFDRPK